ncbi:hypothetical protein V8C86DRAFT_2981497 [Haematococcus lacustris]
MAPSQKLCRAIALTTTLLSVLQLATASFVTVNEEVLIGWRGETHNPELLYDPLHTRNLTDVPFGVPLPASPAWVELVSWEPRVFIWHNFLTEQEALHLIHLAVPSMKRSTVVGQGGKSVEDSYRTSYGTFLKRYQDAVVERVENKVAAWTQVPVSHQEDIQVLRYGIGQSYKMHADTLKDPVAGVRVATVLIYLNEPDEGGETAFPYSSWAHPSLADTYGSGFSDCALGHVGMKPKRGDALLFWSIGPDGSSEDFHATHTGCPVLKGVKWTATKWIHAKPFRPEDLDNTLQSKGTRPQHEDPGICEDVMSQCSEYAKGDGCQRAEEYMVGGPSGLGQCRRSCGACAVCSPGDTACYDGNRRKAGYLVHNPAEIK